MKVQVFQQRYSVIISTNSKNTCLKQPRITPEKTSNTKSCEGPTVSHTSTIRPFSSYLLVLFDVLQLHSSYQVPFLRPHVATSSASEQITPHLKAPYLFLLRSYLFCTRCVPLPVKFPLDLLNPTTSGLPTYVPFPRLYPLSSKSLPNGLNPTVATVARERARRNVLRFSHCSHSQRLEQVGFTPLALQTTAFYGGQALR